MTELEFRSLPEGRALEAFESACRRRGVVPRGVRWITDHGQGRWSDGWSGHTGTLSAVTYLRRHLRNAVVMSRVPEQPAVRLTPEVEGEIMEFLRRKRRADQRKRDRIRSQAVG